MLCICYENILSRTFIHAYINNDVKMTACQLAAVIELLHHHHTHTHTNAWNQQQTTSNLFSGKHFYVPKQGQM